MSQNTQFERDFLISCSSVRASACRDVSRSRHLGSSHLPVSYWPVLETFEGALPRLAAGSFYVTGAQPHLDAELTDTVCLQPGNHPGAVSNLYNHS